MAIAITNASIGTPVNDATGATTKAFTTNVTIAAGDTIVMAAGTNSTVTSVADNSGNGYTWSKDRDSDNDNGIITLVSVYATSGLASGTVITFTYAGSSGKNLIAGFSYSGGASSSRVDQSNERTAFGSNAIWSTSNVTPTVSPSIVVGAFSDFGTGPPGATSTPDSGWVEFFDELRDDFSATAVYQIVPNTTVRNPSGVFNKSMVGSQAGVTVNYKEGAAASSFHTRMSLLHVG